MNDQEMHRHLAEFLQVLPSKFNPSTDATDCAKAEEWALKQGYHLIAEYDQTYDEYQVIIPEPDVMGIDRAVVPFIFCYADKLIEAKTNALIVLAVKLLDPASELLLEYAYALDDSVMTYGIDECGKCGSRQRYKKGNQCVPCSRTQTHYKPNHIWRKVVVVEYISGGQKRMLELECGHRVEGRPDKPIPSRR